nr:transposase (putative), gypsy type [Tanacetum cinerariifolium]
MNAPKDGMPTEGTYSIEAVRALHTHRTPIQKQPKMLLCVVRISRRYYLGDEVYPTFLHDDDREMDLFNLIRAPNPIKVKTGSRSRAPHEVPLLTLTATRVIEMDDLAAATDSSGVPSIIERSPLDFAYEAGASDQGTAAQEMPPSEEVPATSHCEGIMLILDPQGVPIGEKVLLPFNWVWPLLFLWLKMLLKASVNRIRYPLLTLRHAILLMLPSK